MNPKHRRAYESLMKVLTGDDSVTVGEVVSDCPFPLGAMAHSVMIKMCPVDGDRDAEMAVRLRKTVRSADRLLVSVELGQFLNLTGSVQWGRLLSDFGTEDWIYNLVYTFWNHHYTRQYKTLELTQKAMETDHLAEIEHLMEEHQNERAGMEIAFADARANYRQQLDAVQQELGTGKANLELFKAAMRDGFIGKTPIANATRNAIIKALDKEEADWAAAAQIVADNAEHSTEDEQA